MWRPTSSITGPTSKSVHSHTHARAHSHARSRLCVRSHRRPPACKLAWHAHTHAHPSTHPPAPKHTHLHTRAFARTHARPHARAAAGHAIDVVLPGSDGSIKAAVREIKIRAEASLRRRGRAAQHQRNAHAATTRRPAPRCNMGAPRCGGRNGVRCAEASPPQSGAQVVPAAPPRRAVWMMLTGQARAHACLRARARVRRKCVGAPARACARGLGVRVGIAVGRAGAARISRRAD